MTPRHFLIVVTLLVLISDAATAGTRTEALAAQAKKSLLYSPQPDYPLAARSRHISGAGLFQLRVRVRTGRVLDVQIVRSTGYSILDVAAIQALIKWRFKPSALPPLSVENPKRKEPWAAKDSLLKVPIAFSLTKT
jgi:TonB family protein